jgi:tRNA G18 (ribose-2'-O)-methylase SpoU
MEKTKNEELKRLSVEQFKSSDKTPIVIVLDSVRSLNNVGSVFRTADAFLLEMVYLCGITGTPPHREIQKTALGATETVRWKYLSKIAESITELKNNGYKVYAVEQAKEAIMLDNFKPVSQEKIAFIFGSEVGGVSDEAMSLCDGCIEIPQLGMKHSLNIAVSVGIVVWSTIEKINTKFSNEKK